jgi:hypothetical protein
LRQWLQKQAEAPMDTLAHDDTMEETTYLLSNLENASALMKSIHEAEATFPECRVLGPEDIEDSFER